jgi:alginate O-acetyltransferase complex protein AlgF
MIEPTQKRGKRNMRGQNPGSQRTHWSAFPLMVIVLSSLTATTALTQELGRLYAARPPAGSAFVRVAGTNAQIQINSTQPAIGQNDIASRYVAVAANKPLSIAIDSAPLKTDLTPQPGKFYTVAIAQNGADWSEQVIDEGFGDSNDLKAQLRFFNLALGCEPSLQIVDGPNVFERTKIGEFRSRPINPVQVKLQSECEGHKTIFHLQQLRSGDHYSLFFRRVRSDFILSGQFDETEPYREP